MRHGAATYLLAAGVNLKVVRKQLRHSTIILTGNMYMHVLPELQRDAAEKLGAALFGDR